MSIDTFKLLNHETDYEKKNEGEIASDKGEVSENEDD